ncbi:MAG: hypothetical protein RL095_2569 [Verrucomicrobiota bacterium]|jgi:hypothetical protein
MIKSPQKNPLSQDSGFCKACKLLAGLSFSCILAAGTVALLEGPNLATEIFSVVAIMSLLVLMLLLLGLIPFLILTSLWQERRNRRRWPKAECQDPFWGTMIRNAGETSWTCEKEFHTGARINVSFHDVDNHPSESDLVLLAKIWPELQSYQDKAISRLAEENDLPEPGFELASLVSLGHDGTLAMTFHHASDDYGGWEVIFRDGMVIGSVYMD